jgi:hypothetical protein
MNSFELSTTFIFQKNICWKPAKWDFYIISKKKTEKSFENDRKLQPSRGSRHLRQLNKSIDSVWLRLKFFSFLFDTESVCLFTLAMYSLALDFIAGNLLGKFQLHMCSQQQIIHSFSCKTF